MAREVDLRNPNVDRATPDRRDELELLASETSDQLPGEHRIRIENIDPTTGNPSALLSEEAPSATCRTSRTPSACCRPSLPSSSLTRRFNRRAAAPWPCTCSNITRRSLSS